MWKVLGWVLAAIGAVVVVRKAAPWIAEHLRGEKDEREPERLPAAREPRRLPAGRPSASAAREAPAPEGPAPSSPMVGRGPTLVSCGLGGSPSPSGSDPVSGLQSSPHFRWCYVVRDGDTAGSIAEAITGDSARYIELLVANPRVHKKGSMGVVIGPNAWDFADGALSDGTMILVSQTMNAWIDQNGVAAGGYLPYPPDPHEISSSDASSEFAPPPPAPSSSKTSYSPVSGPIPPSTTSPPGESSDGSSASWGDGFDYLGGA